MGRRAPDSPRGHDYHYPDAGSRYDDDYVAGPILEICRGLRAKRILDFGCGNGTFCARLADAGYDVVGCDTSTTGIAVARESVRAATFVLLEPDAEPSGLFTDSFDVVVAMEVIEHLPFPRMFFRFASAVLREGGAVVVSTPYHGYLKNASIALLGKWDDHHAPWWDGGHIKFWSKRSLTRLAGEENFRVSRVVGAGRTRWLWKSMILVMSRERR